MSIRIARPSITVHWLVLTSLVVQQTYAGQQCASCSGIELSDVCHHFIECNNDEKCYMHQYTTESGEQLFDLGCTTSQGCPHSLESIFGKRAEGHHLKCEACCNDTALCNKNLSCNENVNSGVTLPKDCSELVVPNHRNGSYIIFPYGVQHRPVSVYCVFDGDGPWTVIQRRVDGSVLFNRSWDEYKKGFGYSNGNYWLGNDVIHEMTDQSNHELKIFLTDFANVTKYAKYRTFHIADESHGYRLFVTGYSGTAGDSFLTQDGMKFSTFDRDNDVAGGSCAITYQGAWWYAACHSSNLNGQYLSGNHTSYADGIEWDSWHGQHYSLKETTMMIKKH